MRRHFSLSALSLLLLAASVPWNRGLLAQASGDAGHPGREGCWCGYQSGVPRSYVVRGKGSDAAQKEAAADMLREWDRFVRLFDVSVDPEPSLGSRNGVNEVNLFITSEESIARYGVSFDPTTFGVAVIFPDEAFGSFNQCAEFRPEGCGPFVETDVVVNAGFRSGWTADWFAKGADEKGAAALVQTTVLHEVGHTLGLHHVFDVDVDAGYGNSFSAMNYLPDDTGKFVTRMDAKTARGEYPGAAASLVDVAIFPFVYGNASYAETYASLSKGEVRAGDRVTLSGWLVQNVGARKAGPVRVTFHLVPVLARPYPEPFDPVLGTVDFPEGAEVDAEQEMNGTPLLVPAGVPPGDYGIGAIVTVGGREDSPWVPGKPNNNRFLVGHGAVATLRVLAGAGPTPLAADFRFAPAQPIAGEAVSFTDASGGNPASWSWDFGDPASGDSNRSTGPDPAHLFAEVGVHAVTLTVRDGSTASSSTRPVAVLPRFEGGETRADLVLPIVLDLPGRFSTELTIANGGPEDATVRLRYTASPSFGGKGSGSVGPLALRAGRQLVFPDAVGSLRSRGLPIPPGDQGGSLRLEFEGLSRHLDAWAMGRTTSPAGTAGRGGVAYAAVDARGATGGAAIYGLRENGRERSNVGLVNASTKSPVTLCVDVVPAGGTSVSRLGPFTLEPGEWRPLDRVLRLADPSFAEGWAIVDPGPSPAQFLAYGVVNDNGTNDGSYVPAVPDESAGSDLVVPGVVEVGDRFASELVLANPSGTAADVKVEFFESLANPGGLATGVFTFPLSPFEQKIVPDVVNALRKKDPGSFPLPKGGAYAGWLRVVFLKGTRGIPGLAGVRTTHPSAVPRGSFGGFFAGEGLTRHARKAIVFGLRQDASTRSNLALLNPSFDGSPITVALEVVDGATGLVEAKKTLAPLAPMEWRQLDRVLELAPGVESGWVRLSLVLGDGRFVAYGILNDGATPGQGTGDGSMVPMVVIE